MIIDVKEQIQLATMKHCECNLKHHRHFIHTFMLTCMHAYIHKYNHTFISKQESW